MDLKLVCRHPLQLTIDFAPQDSCFHEHFPDHPVVPGSLIIALCMQTLREQTQAQAQAFLVKRFSFSRAAGIGSYLLTIEKNDQDYACHLRQGADIFAHGRITACA